MKKLLFALTLVLCLAVSLVAFTSCGGDGGCEHIWATEATVDTAATCTQEGSQSIKCLDCGEIKADSVTAIPAYGHAYDDGTTVPATCTEDGSVTKTCAVCGDVNTTVIPSAGEHTWSADAIIDVYPTCTTDGAKSIKCTVCQVTKPDSNEVIPASHTWADSASIVVPATCTTEGSKAIKCTVCKEIKPDTTEVIPATGHSDINVVVTPTLFSEGRIKGTCSTCGVRVNEVVPATTPINNVIDPSVNNLNTPQYTASIGEALGDKEFAPGVDLYLEFSILWNETMATINGKGLGWGHIANKADVTSEGDSIVKSFSWLYYRADATWCPFVGGFEFSETKTFTYGPEWKKNSTSENDFVIIDGLDGWHRIGLQYHQNVYENNGEYTYDVTLTVYVDGVKVSESIMDWGAMFYSAEKVNGQVVYTQNENIASYYAVFYRIGNGALQNGVEDNAYFTFGDCILSVGDGFAMPVTKLDTPVDGTYSPEEGAELSAKQYYAYEKSVTDMLYDETLESVEYPVDMITPAAGTVDYSITSGGTKYHRYKEDSNKRVSFINIKDIAFNTVNIDVAEGSKVLYTFFSKMPTEFNEVVSYAIHYRTFIETTEDVTVDIPGNAEYLVLYYQDSPDAKYIPEAITFTFSPDTLSEKLKDNSIETLEYPMSAIKPSQGTIASANLRYIPNFDWVAAFVDITDCAFEQVVFEVNATNGNVCYGFLSEMPDIYDYVEFVGEGTYITFEDQPAGTKITADIPEGAKCLLVYWHDWVDSTASPYYYIPESVTFKNTDPTDANLTDETLDFYEYPMDQVVGTDGAIIYWGSGDQKNAYLTEADGKETGFYKNAFINITDTTFDYVTIVSNGTKKAGWAFISDMPEVGEKVDYVGNFETLNKFAWCVDATGYAKVEIPEGAKYLVLYYEEAGNSYCPASITFTNEDKVGTDVYEYPMDTITPVEGYINHSGTSSNNKAHYLRYKENDERYAFIDLTDLDYNTVTLYAPTNGEATNYTFLTKIPTEDSEQVSYAIGYSDCVWYGLGNGAMTVTIPDNATCLAVLCNYSNQTDTMPEAIVFSNRENNPSEMLKNDALDTYEYPMTEVNASMGTIRGSDGVFILNRQWVAGFVSIEGTVFNKVVFEIDETYGKICYGFLAEYPTLNETVTWAGGATGTTTVTNENGSTVEAWIPADAKVLVVYWNDWDNGAPVYYVPDSITFVKADCDHSEAKVTVITTPTLFSEGECEGTCPICGEDLGGTLAKTEANSYIVTNTLGGAYLIKESERLGDVLGEDEHFYPTEEHPNGQSLYIEFSILLNDSMNNFTNSNISFPGIYTNEVLSSKRGHSAFWFYMWKADGITKGTCDDWTSNSIKSLGYYNEQFALEFDGWHRIGVEFHQNDNIDYETFEITSTMTVTMYYDGVKVYEATLGNGSKAPEEEILLYTAEFVGDDIVYTERVDSHAAYMSYDAYIKDAANPCYIILADQYVSVGTNGFVLDVDRVDNPEAEDYTVAEGVTLSGKVYFEIATETEDTEDAEDVVVPNPGDSEDAEDAETTTPGGSTDSEDAETTTPTNPGFGSASDAEESENAGTTTPLIPGLGTATGN